MTNRQTVTLGTTETLSILSFPRIGAESTLNYAGNTVSVGVSMLRRTKRRERVVRREYYAQK